jgi:hypothetical protein
LASEASKANKPLPRQTVTDAIATMALSPSIGRGAILLLIKRTPANVWTSIRGLADWMGVIASHPTIVPVTGIGVMSRALVIRRLQKASGVPDLAAAVEPYEDTIAPQRQRDGTVRPWPATFATVNTTAKRARLKAWVEGRGRVTP